MHGLPSGTIRGGQGGHDVGADHRSDGLGAADEEEPVGEEGFAEEGIVRVGILRGTSENCER
jgi:hypothetical protein